MTDINGTAFVAYITFKKNANGRVTAFRIAASQDDSEKFEQLDDDRSSPRDESRLSPDLERNEDDLSPLASLCSELIDRFTSGLSHYHQLIAIADVMRGGMTQSLMEDRVYAVAKSAESLARSDDASETYGLTKPSYVQVNQAISQLRETDAGMALLPASILLSLVATFDSLIGDAIKSLLVLKPDKLQNSDKTITYRDLFEIGDLDTARKSPF